MLTSALQMFKCKHTTKLQKNYYFWLRGEPSLLLTCKCRQIRTSSGK